MGCDKSACRCFSAFSPMCYVELHVDNRPCCSMVPITTSNTQISIIRTKSWKSARPRTCEYSHRHVVRAVDNMSDPVLLQHGQIARSFHVPHKNRPPRSRVFPAIPAQASENIPTLFLLKFSCVTRWDRRSCIAPCSVLLQERQRSSAPHHRSLGLSQLCASTTP